MLISTLHLFSIFYFTHNFYFMSYFIINLQCLFTVTEDVNYLMKCLFKIVIKISFRGVSLLTLDSVILQNFIILLSVYFYKKCNHIWHLTQVCYCLCSSTGYTTSFDTRFRGVIACVLLQDPAALFDTWLSCVIACVLIQDVQPHLTPAHSGVLLPVYLYRCIPKANVTSSASQLP